MQKHSTSTATTAAIPNADHAQTDQADDVVLQDASSERTFFTMLPNIVLTLDLSPYALTLYIHLKKVTGEAARGVCFKKSATLVEEVGMSAGRISKAKKELARPFAKLGGKALINIEARKNLNGGKPRHHITLTDIWAVNIAAFTKPEAISSGERASSYSEIASSSGELAISPGEIKKNPPEENHTKQNTHTQNHLRAVGAPAVVVGADSKFSLEECRRYANNLHASGQGVSNPGGFARSIHRSGAEDANIELFLHGTTPSQARARDIAQCPDCEGSTLRPVAGPGDYSKGVMKCGHERLDEQGAA
jgi:hypothetical protein